eukprot:447932-Hanusia_phi.AAC.1
MRPGSDPWRGIPSSDRRAGIIIPSWHAIMCDGPITRMGLSESGRPGPDRIRSDPAAARPGVRTRLRGLRQP